jgi:hypothetical protein
MAKRRASLTGSWSGAYRYPGEAREVVFNARLEENGGAFIGTTQEPNDFAPTAGAVLYATIEGSRTGSAVTFTKFYDHADVRHSIRYDGEADEALMRIEGRWLVRAGLSGAFFMVREDDGEAVEVKEAAEIEAPR